MRSIVFDLEGVLVNDADIDLPVLNPEASAILQRAKSDFDKVLVWTAIGHEKAFKALSGRKQKSGTGEGLFRGGGNRCFKRVESR